MKTTGMSLMMSLGMLFASASAAQAAIIYQDSFSRNGSLNGTAPDVVNLPVQNWIAGSVTTDGSQAADASGATAFLLPCAKRLHGQRGGVVRVR